jgi:hypothetical protein
MALPRMRSSCKRNKNQNGTEGNISQIRSFKKIFNNYQKKKTKDNFLIENVNRTLSRDKTRKKIKSYCNIHKHIQQVRKRKTKDLLSSSYDFRRRQRKQTVQQKKKKLFISNDDDDDAVVVAVVV